MYVSVCVCVNKHDRVYTKSQSFPVKNKMKTVYKRQTIIYLKNFSIKQ